MLKLGGREFDVIREGTIEWDVTLLNLLQGCGLADVTLMIGETAEQLAMRVYRTLMSQGAVFEILGCVLNPAGEDPLKWTPSRMAETAAFVRALSSKADKAAITSQINSLVAGFFQQGLLSVRTFPSYSTPAAAAIETETQPRNLPSEATSTASSANGA
jgi:hypothetical protein